MALLNPQIYYPGSQVVGVWGYGGSGNANGEPAPAQAVALLNTPAAEPVVTAWYQSTLPAAGWFKGESYLDQNHGFYQFAVLPPQSVYAEYLWLDFRPKQFGATVQMPDAGTTYTLTLEVGSPSLP